MERRHENYLDGRHSNRDMEILSIICCFHHGDAVGALHILSRILARGNEDCGDNVAGMSIESSESPSNCRSGKILNHVEFYQCRYIRLENLLDHLLLYDRLTNHRFASSFNPIHSSWLLVGTEIT